MEQAFKGVFLDAGSLGNDIDLSKLAKLGCTFWPKSANSEVIERCLGADYIVTNKVVIDAHIMSKLPKLKLICVAATGTNNIDLAAAEARNIMVKNVSDYAGSSIAQLTFSLLGELWSHTSKYNALVKNGDWCKSEHFCLFDKPIVEFSGKKIGLIGYGTLAKSVEKIARAYDMEIIIAERKGAEYVRSGRVSFQHVIEEADVISIHSPLTLETKNLISTPELNSMKATAVVINTARGGIVNEPALLKALGNNTIAGAATDVLTVEPPSPEHQMLTHSLDNLLVTPHIAWASMEARKRLLNKVIENIESYFN